MFHVSADEKKKIYQEFGRTEEMVDEDVETIKKWIKSQLHLSELMEDVKIRNFLHLNKFSIEKTKSKIDMYYTIRSLIPDFYVNNNPKGENMQRVLDLMYFGTHSDAFNERHRVYLVRVKTTNTLPVEELIKLIFCSFEVRLYEDFISDDIFLFDMENVALNDYKKITLTIMNNAFAAYKKVYSLRLRSMHFLNSPSYISMALTVLKTVMKPKIFDRIRVHQDAEILKELFSNEKLPKEYGGNGTSLRELTEMTRRKFSEYQKRFDLLDNLRVDESLRPEKLCSEMLSSVPNFIIPFNDHRVASQRYVSSVPSYLSLWSGAVGNDKNN